jgi:hypothetical protein
MKAAFANDFVISRKNFSDVAAVSVRLESETMAVAAYGDSRIPSIILTQDEFARDSSLSQKMRFKTIFFEEFEGYKIWSCDIDGDEMNVCLVKSITNS